MTREIAKLIILAQASSDVGKGIGDLYYALPTGMQKKANYGYPSKDMAIYDLLRIMSRNPRRDAHFYVCEDTERVAYFIVYFDFMLGSSKVQVSFHSFDKRLKQFLTGSRRSHTEWKSELESRNVCFALAERFGYIRPGFTVSP